MKQGLVTVIGLIAIANSSPGEITSERQTVAGEEKQEYFLIHDAEAKPPRSGAKLLLVMPGGDGSANFNPFITNMAKHAIGDGYVVAQLISVKWTPMQGIIWPTDGSNVEDMQFTTEEFLEAVIGDLEKSQKIKFDPEHIYTLSWSSSGPAAYVASLSVERIKGSFVAMSVFKERAMKRIKRANGHRYYIYHSPDDKVCPPNKRRSRSPKREPKSSSPPTPEATAGTAISSARSAPGSPG